MGEEVLKAREIWNALAEHQSPDGTWLQVGWRDFEQLVASTLTRPSTPRQGGDAS
jgi:hypothetical protein